MDELNDLLKELEGIKAKQKALNERESSIKEQIKELLKEGGHDKAESLYGKAESLYGTVRLQRRYEKDYGDEIRTMEIKLKEAKKLADDMGDFQLMGFKESIVYVPPKDIL